MSFNKASEPNLFVFIKKIIIRFIKALETQRFYSIYRKDKDMVTRMGYKSFGSVWPFDFKDCFL